MCACGRHLNLAAGSPRKLGGPTFTVDVGRFARIYIARRPRIQSKDDVRSGQFIVENVYVIEKAT
jgi:hypothetical protein